MDTDRMEIRLAERRESADSEVVHEEGMQEEGAPLTDWKTGTCLQGGMGRQDLPPTHDRPIDDHSEVRSLDGGDVSRFELVTGFPASLESHIHDVRSRNLERTRNR